MKIKKSRNLPTKTGSTDRQVMLYPGTFEETVPGNMDDIKISIVNEQACVLKRKRSTAATPSSKRLRSAVFKCSTPLPEASDSYCSPSTSNSRTVKCVSSGIPCIVEEDLGLDEWDDSLLEPSDDEDDTALSMSEAQMESILAEDSCYAAEPSGLDHGSSARFITLDFEQVSTSPCAQTDSSSTLTEENEEDLSNYAAMALSPSHSDACSVKGDELGKNSSVIIEERTDSGEEKTIAHEVSTLVTPGSDKKEELSCQLESDSLTNFSDQAISMYTVDIAVEWNEDPELTFDRDIDGLLAVSPRSTSSSEEERTAEPDIQQQCRSVVPDPTTSLQHLESVCVQTGPSAGSNTTDVVQQLSSSSSNMSDSLKVHLPSFTVSEPLKDSLSSSTSTAISSKPQLRTAASNVAQDVNPSTSAEIGENKCTKDVTSNVDLTNQTVNTSAELTSGSQQKITDSVSGNETSSPSMERPPAAVTALPRPAPRPTPAPRTAPRLRPSISISALEARKDRYYNHVYLHITGLNNSADPQTQLATLANDVCRDDQNWQHPSNFYKRNSNLSGRAESYTLNQWVTRNGAAVQRFKNLPRKFQRSPVPEALPF